MEGTLYEVWAAIGPLIGVFIGFWLTARWQRRQWILVNKKAEFRGILDALHTYRWQVTKHERTYGPGSIRPDATGERAVDQTALAEALNSIWTTLSDRIFIREALVNSTVHQDLQTLHRSLVSDNPPSLEQWVKNWYELHRKLLRMAERELGLKEQAPWLAKDQSAAPEGESHG
jgi:hypothetical protein